MDKMTPRSVDPFSSPDEAKIATSSAPIGQDEYIFPLSDLSVLAWLRLELTGETDIGSEILHWNTAGQSSRNRTG
jgi:hypothetical protein